MIIVYGLSIIKEVLEECRVGKWEKGRRGEWESGRIEKGEKYSALLNLGMIHSL